VDRQVDQQVMRRLLLPLATLALATGPLGAQSQADHRAVREAVLDYVEAIYEVKPERIARSVHPTLVKQGMARGADGNAYRGPLPMNYQQLYDLAATWNKDNRNADPATAPKVIEVYDVQDATVDGQAHGELGHRLLPADEARRQMDDHADRVADADGEKLNEIRDTMNEIREPRT
jgi:hypothetical protein